jgi:hypothetical protein
MQSDAIHIQGPSPPQQKYGMRGIVGNLEYLIKVMNNCKKFYGVDSGIAHLACVLGIDSKIIISVNKYFCKGVLQKEGELKIDSQKTLKSVKINPSLFEFYKKCYPQAEVYEDKDIFFL